MNQLGRSVSEIAAAQCASALRDHPDPATLWTLIGGPRMWRRRPTDPDFCVVRVGMGVLPLARRVVAPPVPAEEVRDPVTATAVRRFLHTHATVPGPVTVDLGAGSSVTIDGDAGAARAVVCQLAVLHVPDQVGIAAVVGDHDRAHWDWLKWLPHKRHPMHYDALGPMRMVYSTAAQAQQALAGLPVARLMLVAERGVAPIAGATVIAIGAGDDGAPVTIRTAVAPGPDDRRRCPDVCAPAGRAAGDRR
nr:hypothetical protein [Mycobacterium lepraemurium]